MADIKKRPVGWVITSDGKEAWLWGSPKTRISLIDADLFCRQTNVVILSDDRKTSDRFYSV